MTRILIADDHAIVRQGLRQILGATREHYVIGESADANDAIRKIREQHWDIVLLDINLPGKNGIDALKQIRSESPETRVLVFSFHTEDSFALRALRNGASGYITKNSPPEQLLSAISRILRGGKYITQSVAEKLANVFDSDFDRPPHERLTDREFQIFHLLAGGKTVSEIAGELSLSVKTISTHRAKILHKLHLRNNAQLMYYSMHNMAAGTLMVAEEAATENS
jgi:two-component system, NarL family, invasion response regulator UvrY